MKKILTALVMALTFTTGAFSQPAQELPSFLQNTQAVSMTDSQMSEVRGENLGVLIALASVGAWYVRDIYFNEGRGSIEGTALFLEAAGMIPYGSVRDLKARGMI